MSIRKNVKITNKTILNGVKRGEIKMEKDIKKVITILIIGVIIILLLTFHFLDNKKEESIKDYIDNESILAYTIDGEVAKEKPTKELGYIVNKIVCDNGSDVMWDNDNWEVELTDVKGKDRCMVDFTKDESRDGYRVTVTSNIPNVLESTSYATTENGTVIIYSTSTIESVSGCNGIVEGNKVIVRNVTENQTCNITFNKITLADTIKEAYPSNGERTDFSSVYETTALHTATDYNASGSFSGTSYYFTGNPNNWVSFAGKKWRIIRINGNGSVRLLYAGSGGEDGYIDGTTYKYNTSYRHPSYVGWKYTYNANSISVSTDRGNGTKSNAYSKVESWYNSNIASSYSNYIDGNAIYCNDRNIGSGSYSTSFNYAAYTRLYTNKTPTYECSNAADIFNNFGLMTADEVSYAGGLYGNDNESAYYYLNAIGRSSTGGNWWWTMSPSYFVSGGYAFVFAVDGSSIPGRLNANRVDINGVVRPVISLKSSVLVTGGSGTGSDPYTLTI